MIRFEDASFAYRAGEEDEVRALQGIDLRIEPGEFVAVIGHNGSGKSTLSKLLVAVLFPTQGQIHVDDIPVTPATRWEIRRRVAIVFQDPDDQLVANRVADDCAFGPENLGLPRHEIDARVRWSLDALELGPLADRLVEDLSPSQKQRLAIAGALAMRPRFLILDEPTSLLPVPLARRLLVSMRQLHDEAGTGVIHITHFMAEAALFDRVIVLDQGRVVLDGTPAQVFAAADRLRHIGLDVPVAASLAARLRAHGLSLPPDITTDADLRRGLQAVVA
jgi:energy-coupling factor transport system ATP-binding protein